MVGWGEEQCLMQIKEFECQSQRVLWTLVSQCIISVETFH